MVGSFILHKIGDCNLTVTIFAFGTRLMKDNTIQVDVWIHSIYRFIANLFKHKNDVGMDIGEPQVMMCMDEVNGK